MCHQNSAPLHLLDFLFLQSHLILEEELCLCKQMDSSRSTHKAFAVQIALFLDSLVWFGSCHSFLPYPPALWRARLGCVFSLTPRRSVNPLKPHVLSQGRDMEDGPAEENGGAVAQRSRNVCLAGKNNRYSIRLPLACWLVNTSFL